MSSGDVNKAADQLWAKISGSSDKSGDITMEELYDFVDNYSITNKGSSITFKDDASGSDEDGKGDDKDDDNNDSDEEKARKA